MIVINDNPSKPKRTEKHNDKPDDNTIENNSNIIQPQYHQNKINNPIPDNHRAIYREKYKSKRHLEVILSKKEVDIYKSNED